MGRQLRVLVANSPRLMREIVIDTFAGQPDITIVGEVADDAEIVARVEETHPDFLFIALDDFRARPPVCDAILRLHPEVNIIAVSPREDRSVRYWASFNIHSDVIESSEEAILDAMRRAGSLAGGVS
jgi:AmiR/NasT family two-component response regulator